MPLMHCFECVSKQFGFFGEPNLDKFEVPEIEQRVEHEILHLTRSGVSGEGCTLTVP